MSKVNPVQSESIMKGNRKPYVLVPLSRNTSSSSSLGSLKGKSPIKASGLIKPPAAQVRGSGLNTNTDLHSANHKSIATLTSTAVQRSTLPSPSLIADLPHISDGDESDMTYVTVDSHGKPARPFIPNDAPPKKSAPLPSQPAHPPQTTDFKQIRPPSHLVTSPPLTKRPSPIAPDDLSIERTFDWVVELNGELDPSIEEELGKMADEEGASSGGYGESEEEEKPRPEFVDSVGSFPPSHQPRRPYEPRQKNASTGRPRLSQVDFDVKLDSSALLASFLTADRAAKKGRPQRRDIDEDNPEPAEREDIPESGSEEARGESEGEREDEELPSANEVLAQRKLGKLSAGVKGKEKATSQGRDTSAGKDQSLEGEHRSSLRTSKTPANMADVADSDDSLDIPSGDKVSAPRKKKSEELTYAVSKAERKKHGKGKGKNQKASSSTHLNTETLLDMLPRRKRKVVVPVETDDEEEDQVTDYEQEHTLSKSRRSDKPREKPERKGTRKNKRSMKMVPSPTSEEERKRQRRIREYKDLEGFSLGTETVA
ncbi:hypothetical protein T439DRAFT_379079 [Meredithblackwellia eburnea MCA 4105]